MSKFVVPVCSRLLNTSVRLPVARLTRISAPVPPKVWSSTIRLPPVASVVTLVVEVNAGPAPTQPPEPIAHAERRPRSDRIRRQHAPGAGGRDPQQPRGERRGIEVQHQDVAG